MTDSTPDETPSWTTQTRELLDGRSTVTARVIDGLIIVLIILSCTAVVVETLPHLPEGARPWLRRFEVFSVSIFTLEYLLRVFSALSPRRKALEPMVLIDLLAILPFYVGLFAVGQFDLRFLRILRTVRVLRVLKMRRYSNALVTMVEVVRETMPQLLSFLFVAFICLVLMGSGLYNIEPQTFESIPHAIWWSVVTLTTVGYGDIVPQTGLGQAVAGCLMLLGIGVVAIPTGIISSAMVDRYLRNSTLFCPECELSAHDPDARFCKRCSTTLEFKPDSSMVGGRMEDSR